MPQYFVTRSHSRAWRCCHTWTWLRAHHVKGERWNEPSICDQVQKEFQMALSLGDIFSGLMSVFRLSPAIVSFHPPTTSSEKWRTATCRSMQLKIVEYPPLLKCSGGWNPWIWGNSSCSSWVFQLMLVFWELCWLYSPMLGILGMEILQKHQLWDCKRDPRKAECIRMGWNLLHSTTWRWLYWTSSQKNTRNQLSFFFKRASYCKQISNCGSYLCLFTLYYIHALGTFFHQSSNIAR